MSSDEERRIFDRRSVPGLWLAVSVGLVRHGRTYEASRAILSFFCWFANSLRHSTPRTCCWTRTRRRRAMNLDLTLAFIICTASFCFILSI